MISRKSHHAENTPAYAGAPTDRLKYAPSIPHVKPRMNANPQITNADPKIRIPACRNDSPKNLITRNDQTSPTTRAQNFAISPNDETQSLGTASQLMVASPESCGRRRRTRRAAG